MATQTQVENTLLAASLMVANLVNENGEILTGGGLTVKWGYINLVQRAINCVQRQYNLSDYVSTPFILAYDRLLNFVGINTGGNINPNAQGTNTIINVNITGPTFQTLNKTDANLVYDAGADSWYLPFLNNSGAGFPIGSVPVSILLNGVQMEPALNTAFVPQRIYGFANNTPVQIITVTVAVP